MTASAAPIEPNVWRDLFVGRLALLRHQIPAELSGGIQFEVRSKSGVTAWFLSLGPQRVASREGLSPSFDEWVVADAMALDQLVSGEGQPKLHVTGSRRLLQRVLRWMAGQRAPQRAGLFRGAQS